MSGISQSRLREKEASRLEAEAAQEVREKLAAADAQTAQLDELQRQLEASEQLAQELQAQLTELRTTGAVSADVYESTTAQLRSQIERVVGERDEALAQLDTESTRADRAEGGLAAVNERADRAEAAVVELRSARTSEAPAQNEGPEPKKKASKAGGEG